MNMNVLMENELRPCEVRTKHECAKMLFHGWFVYSRVIPPSRLKDGHKGGVVQDIVALVENENGRMYVVNPGDIHFIDDKVKRVFKEGCYAETPGECADLQSSE